MGTLLRWTGQQRYALILALCVAVGGLCLVAVSSGEFLPIDRDAGLYVLFAGVALWFFGFVGLCSQIRCPNCRERVIWRSLHNRENDPALRSLLAWSQCRLCGYSASDRRRV